MDDSARVERFQKTVEKLRLSVSKAVVGQDDVVEQVLICMLAGGHALLEGAPGLGKTLLVRSLAQAMELAFSRIQFTPDLMPGDIIGTNIVVEDERGRKRFELTRGPIFGQLVLADEINRATPKTQSALLEAMAEGTVTIAGTRHKLDEPFCVLATENPIEMEGTYPLPEAQLDRFLFKVLVPSPDEDTLVRIFDRTTGNEQSVVEQVVSSRELLEMRELVRAVRVAEPVTRYVARLIRATEPATGVASARKLLRYGASVRGGQALLLGAKAAALMAGRGHVAIADVKNVAPASLRHRLSPSFEAEADGVTPDAILARVIDEVPEVSPGVQQVAS